MAWSPDGSKLASGGLDTTVKVWDAVGGACLLTLTVRAVLMFALMHRPARLPTALHAPRALLPSVLAEDQPAQATKDHVLTCMRAWCLPTYCNELQRTATNRNELQRTAGAQRAGVWRGLESGRGHAGQRRLGRRAAAVECGSGGDAQPVPYKHEGTPAAALLFRTLHVVRCACVVFAGQRRQ